MESLEPKSRYSWRFWLGVIPLWLVIFPITMLGIYAEILAEELISWMES